MTREGIWKVLKEIVEGIQERSGREPIEVKRTMVPIGDLPKFDSLNGVEATIELSSRLEFDFPDMSLFTNTSNTRPLRLSETLDKICAELELEA